MKSKIEVQRICQHCGNEFTARTTVTRFCSHKCACKAHKQKVRAGKVEQSDKETQQIRNQPIEQLNAKAFLSIADTCKLIGISRRSVYRMIERGELITGKAGKRTIIRRSDLEQLLFEQPRTVASQPEKQPEQKHFEITDCYALTEVQKKFGISSRALLELVKRNSIPRIKKGRFVYVPKTEIDKVLILTPQL
jgi:excisionase family DNA binding protein